MPPQERARVRGGGHHERMDGKGYPRGLTRDQMSVQARMMGIADIFGALTAADRPYKNGMTLSQALAIMCKMRDNGHIDPDLFEMFVREGVHLRYGREFLDHGQVDEIPPSWWPRRWSPEHQAPAGPGGCTCAINHPWNASIAGLGVRDFRRVSQ
ncbi:MAG: HD domain-containing phosphohydrolase [Rhodoferax sp.]